MERPLALVFFNVQSPFLIPVAQTNTKMSFLWLPKQNVQNLLWGSRACDWIPSTSPTQPRVFKFDSFGHWQNPLKYWRRTCRTQFTGKPDSPPPPIKYSLGTSQLPQGSSKISLGNLRIPLDSLAAYCCHAEWLCYAEEGAVVTMRPFVS